ncbi:TetR/AcrR family transcriptional regulator [Thaumasiovibrio sp. DFM-14]|uniref:TetR/AcrR family transcriptional regulator n=1 Tax=Thaumasiovibrio sp. DFM-14 TaxID=3384792 RepID=UPI00399F85D6
MTSQGSDTKSQIIQSALSLLKASGTEGLTMRQVAAVSGRSLSNVQHHFKNKKALLVGMAAYYFEQCDRLAEQYAREWQFQNSRQGLFDLVLFCLDNADQVSDACLVFREMWAISLRNAEIETQLINYYQSKFNKLCLYWAEYEVENAKKAASLLLPFIEGYSIQHNALPLSKEQVAEMLSDTLYTVLNGHQNTA